MKTFKLLFLLFFVVPMLNAQPVLRYETHGLQADYTHVTEFIKNISPQQGGENQIWNFSNFECKNNKVSEIVEASETPQGAALPYSNISLIDSSKYFYFNVDEFGIEYHGLITPNSIINFDNPIIKMSYPFTYGDFFDEEFSGTGIYYNSILTDIYGTYSVEADGYGTLILPGDVTINNVLRVKTVNHIFEVGCATTEFYNTKYLWYSADYRYPILVITENSRTYKGNKTFTNYGYFNEKAYQTSLNETNSELSRYSVKVYPNPFVEFVNISYNLQEDTKVSIEIYNTSGILVQSLLDNQNQTGRQNYVFNPTLKGLAVGTYFVKMTFNNEIVFKRIIMTD